MMREEKSALFEKEYNDDATWEWETNPEEILKKKTGEELLEMYNDAKKEFETDAFNEEAQKDMELIKAELLKRLDK